MHGFSDLMVQVFGERGKHTRSAIGTNALPNKMSVEVESIVCQINAPLAKICPINYSL